MIKNILSKISHFFDRQSVLSIILVFLVSFVYFYFLIQPFQTLPDADSFYHAKTTEMILENGVIENFYWLPFSVLKDNFTDQHFLYHILLAPFVYFFGGLLGIKIASIFFASLAVAVIYWFLRVFKIRGAMFYILILLFTGPFIVRINLAKSGSLAITLVFLSLYALFKKKPILLFILSFVYVWTHGSWPNVLVLSAVYLLVSLLFKDGGLKENLKLFFACFFGLFFGFIINPYFPKNISFYWDQIVQIALLNHQDKIAVGAEWYPPKLREYIVHLRLVLDVFFISLVSFIFTIFKHKELKEPVKKEDTIQVLTLLICAGAFFILTIKSQRNVEYFAPLLAVFSAFLMNFILKINNNFFARIKALFANRALKALAIFVFLILVIFFPALGIKSARDVFKGGRNFNYLKPHAEEIARISKPGEIVFNADFDDFPPLFYFNDKNYYITGLDPTFLYLFNQELYKKYEGIYTGATEDNLYEIIKNDFKSSFVFLDKTHKKFEENLRKDRRFEEVYKDNNGSVFKIN
jgi:hypothetical protein